MNTDKEREAFGIVALAETTTEGPPVIRNPG